MTHAQACERRRPTVPPSDCGGRLMRRRLRPGDWAWRCTACGVTVWFDGDGAVSHVAHNGTPLHVDRSVAE